MEQLKLRTDVRGMVFEPLESEAFVHQRNAHVVISLPGAIRGNHYHKQGTEIVAVMGPARVRIRENNIIEEFTVPSQTVYRFSFPPMVSHAIQNIGTSPHILIAFNTIKHDPDSPDSFTDVLIHSES